MVWKTIGVPGGEWVLRSERVQEFWEVMLEGGSIGTEYRTWGTFGGPMAYALSWAGTQDDIVDRGLEIGRIGLKGDGKEWEGVGRHT
jgi:hypothetical protein